MIEQPLLWIVARQRSAELLAEADQARLAASVWRRKPMQLRLGRIPKAVTTRRILSWGVPAGAFLTAAATLWLEDQALADLVWHRVFISSWASWCAFPLVQGGYYLLGRFVRNGWWLLILSQAFLVLVGILSGQVGLIAIAAFSSFRAFRSWQQFGKPNPVVVRLQGELETARRRIAELEEAPQLEPMVLTGPEAKSA
jgi:hypothetical protein